MDKIITVLGYKNFITEMSDAPDCSKLYTVLYHIQLLSQLTVNFVILYMYLPHWQL